MDRAETLRVGAVLAAGVIVPGLANYWLSAAGHEALGTAVWVTGYLAAVTTAWYVWIRPLDLRGSGG